MEEKKLDDGANDVKQYSHSAPGNGHQIKRRQRSWTHRTPPQQAAKTGDVMDILHNPDLENY